MDNSVPSFNLLDWLKGIAARNVGLNEEIPDWVEKAIATEIDRLIEEG
jgi:hypothetical protein